MLNARLKDKSVTPSLGEEAKSQMYIIRYVTNAKWIWAGHIARLKDNRWTIGSTEWRLRAAGNKPARGKVLQTCLSPLRQERVGRAGVLVCLVVQSNQRRSDPPPGRRNERMPYNCYDSSVENNDISV